MNVDNQEIVARPSGPLLTVIAVSNTSGGVDARLASKDALVEWINPQGRYLGEGSGKMACAALSSERRKRKVVAAQVNAAISLSAGEWVMVLFGDEALDAEWKESICACLGFDEACTKRDVIVFRSESGQCLPLLVVRRQAFVYGSLDGSFECERLLLWHWLHEIYESRRKEVLPTKGVLERNCTWLVPSPAPLPLTAPLTVLARFGQSIDPDVRLALLDSALAAPELAVKELEDMHQETLQLIAGRKVGNPYYSGDYDPRRFWQENTRGYVRWEAYQPDECEIEEVATRVQPQSVLELGCGVGRNARYFKSANRYSGIDISSNLLMRSLDRREANWLGNVCGTITQLPFANGSWDLVFADSTVQHVIPNEIDQCVAEILRVSARYICLIEYTAEESEGGSWFRQVHMFPHDYQALFAPHCNLLWHTETSLRVHPARKEVFLFEKR